MIFDLLNNIIHKQYALGTPECDKAFTIFNIFGFIIIALAIVSILIAVFKSKDVENKILAKDRRK